MDAHVSLHVAISYYHVVCKAVAARIIRPYWQEGKWNFSDIMTKEIPKSEFWSHVSHIFYCANHHLCTKNSRLDEDYED